MSAPFSLTPVDGKPTKRYDAISLTRAEMARQEVVVKNPEATVYTGVMPQWGSVLDDAGETLISFENMSYRGLWSYLRLQLGKRKADKLINEVRAPWKESLEAGDIDQPTYKMGVFDAMKDLLPEITNLRKIQFIMRDTNVYATASTKHLLVPKKLVEESFKRVIPTGSFEADLGMATASLAQLGGLQEAFEVQFQMDPGNILTRKAIRVGFGLRIKSCFNPLTFINGGGLDRFFNKPTYGYTRGRVLRVENKTNLDDRIREAYEASKDAVGQMKNDIQRAKDTTLTKDQSNALGAAFPLAFGCGTPVIKQVFNRYTAEASTLWGLAMAVSYVARHGEMRADAKKLPQNLANAAAGYLWVDDVKGVVERCNKWLENVKKINREDYL